MNVKKKEANIDKDIEEEWKLVHTVTYPQKYYKRGTELYVSNYGRCKEKLNDEEKIYYPQTKCFAGNHINVLVYKNFISDIPEGYVVSYIDGNKSNNHINNLTLISKSDNLLRNHTNAFTNNPNYIKLIKIREKGKRCITNGIENKKVRPIDAEYYINNEGWRYGMTIKNT